jgi:hypothetical protein
MIDAASVKNCLAVAAKATPSPVLYLRWDGSIVEAGTGPDPTHADVELFEHAQHWVTELGTALLAVASDRNALAITVDEFRAHILRLTAERDALKSQLTKAAIL